MRPSSDPDENPPDPDPAEECGVFGVWAPGEDVANLTYYGLYALQHRGQEAAGMAVSDGRRTVVYKDLGLVSQVFDEQVLCSLQGHIAVGHCRYSTTGSTTWENAQPTFRTTAAGSGIALGHNGNLVNTAELRDEVAALNHRGGMGASTDSDLVTELLAATAADIGVEEAAMRLLPRLRGAYSLVFADEGTLYAARDPHGVRPLVLGRLERGWVIASETAALSASRPVITSESVVAPSSAERPRPAPLAPRSRRRTSSAVLTRLPLCPRASPVPAAVVRNVGWAFSHVGEPVVE